MKGKGSAEVNTSAPDGSLNSASEIVEHGFAPKGSSPKAYIEVELGTTEPTKPYANIKVGVKLGLYVDVSEIDEAYEFALQWADDKVEKVLTTIREGLQDE